jgi:hypothetical protein
MSYTVFKEFDIAVMMVARMRWLGHVIRTDVRLIPEQELFAEPWGHR